MQRCHIFWCADNLHVRSGNLHTNSSLKLMEMRSMQMSAAARVSFSRSGRCKRAGWAKIQPFSPRGLNSDGKHSSPQTHAALVSRGARRRFLRERESSACGGIVFDLWAPNLTPAVRATYKKVWSLGSRAGNKLIFALIKRGRWRGIINVSAPFLLAELTSLAARAPSRSNNWQTLNAWLVRGA